jgi:hypothetical protein
MDHAILHGKPFGIPLILLLNTFQKKTFLRKVETISMENAI